MKPTIYFIHMPRTGGTSVIEYFKENESLLDAHHYGHNKYDHNKRIELEKEAGKNNFICFTILRDPVDQLISKYSFMKHNNHLLHDIAANNSFSNWLRITEERMTNLYSGWFENSLPLIGNVLNTNHLTKEFNELISKFNLPEFNIHINNFPKVIASEDDIAFIKKIRSKDYELLKNIGFKL